MNPTPMHQTVETITADLPFWVRFSGIIDRVSALLIADTKMMAELKVASGTEKGAQIGVWENEKGRVNIFDDSGTDQPHSKATDDAVKKFMNHIGRLIKLKYAIDVTELNYRDADTYRILDAFDVAPPEKRLVSDKASDGETTQDGKAVSEADGTQAQGGSSGLFASLRKMAARKKPANHDSIIKDAGKGTSVDKTRLLMETRANGKPAAVRMHRLVLMLWLYEAGKFCAPAMKHWDAMFTQQPKSQRSRRPKRGLFSFGKRTPAANPPHEKTPPASPKSKAGSTGDDMSVDEVWKASRLHISASFDRLDKHLKSIIFGGSAVFARKFAAREAALTEYQTANGVAINTGGLLRGMLGGMFRLKGDKQAKKIVSKYPGSKLTMELDADVKKYEDDPSQREALKMDSLSARGITKGTLLSIGIWVKKLLLGLGGAPAALVSEFGILLSGLAYSATEEKMRKLAVLLKKDYPFSPAECRDYATDAPKRLSPTRMLFRVVGLVWKYNWRPGTKRAFTSPKRLLFGSGGGAGGKGEQEKSSWEVEKEKLEAISYRETRRLVYHYGPMFGIDFDPPNISGPGGGEEKKSRKKRRRRRRKRMTGAEIIGIYAFAYTVILFVIVLIFQSHTNAQISKLNAKNISLEKKMEATNTALDQKVKAANEVGLAAQSEVESVRRELSLNPSLHTLELHRQSACNTANRLKEEKSESKRASKDAIGKADAWCEELKQRVEGRKKDDKLLAEKESEKLNASVIATTVRVENGVQVPAPIDKKAGKTVAEPTKSPSYSPLPPGNERIAKRSVSIATNDVQVTAANDVKE